MKLIISIICTLGILQSSLAIKVSKVSDINGNELIITEIDLSNKGLLEVPVEILKCKNLKKLNLSNNGLVKIPLGLAQLRQLKELNLSSNTGLSPIDLDAIMSNATFQLESFLVADCNLIYLPDALSKNKKLKTIDVSGNRLSCLPFSMMELTALETINLAENDLHDLAWIVNYWWGLKSIDMSGNKDLKVSSVLVSLSYFDQLNQVIIGDLDFFPKDFELLNTQRLVIKNSNVESFPRTHLSTKINQLVFDNCKFSKPGTVIGKINEFVQPDYVELRNIQSTLLTPFLALETDSVALKNIGLADIDPLSNVKGLKWVDTRGNEVSLASVERLKKAQPGIKILTKEFLEPNIGISPPIERFIAPLVERTITTGKEVNVQLGKANFDIPTNAIVDSKGNAYSGNVTLEYQEYMSATDVFFSGITMTSTTNNETMLFASGGMFKLNATDENGNQLFVDPENPIAVNLFSKSADTTMELFRLNENGMWQTMGQDVVKEPFRLDQAKLDSVKNRDFLSIAKSQVQVITDRYIPVVKKNRKNKTFEITFQEFRTKKNSSNVDVSKSFIQVYEPDFASKFLTHKTFLFEGDSSNNDYEFLDSIHDFCKKQYKRLKIVSAEGTFYNQIGPNYMTNLELVPDFENDNFKLKFLFKERKIELPVNILSSETNANRGIKECENFYKKYVRSWKKTKKIKNRNKIRLKSALIKKANFLKDKAESEEKARQQFYYDNALILAESVGEGSIIRAFQITGFGVWNCDVRQRMNAPKDMPTTFVSEEGEQVKSQPEKVVVIDHLTNGVIQFEKEKPVFFDAASRSTIVVFFSATLVGIYTSWKNLMNEKETEVKLLNIENMSKENFVKHICDEG